MCIFPKAPRLSAPPAAPPPLPTPKFTTEDFVDQKRAGHESSPGGKGRSSLTVELGGGSTSGTPGVNVPATEI